MRYASAGGQDEQPCEVNNSTRVGGVAGSIGIGAHLDRSGYLQCRSRLFVAHPNPAKMKVIAPVDRGDDCPPHAAGARDSNIDRLDGWLPGFP